jgi:hypothetical protein
MIEVSIDKRHFQQIETFLTFCKERFFTFLRLSNRF